MNLTFIIEEWGNWTKVKPYLRSGDIPSLTHQILEEFYHNRLSCGHLVRSIDEGVSLAFEDFIVDRGDTEHGGGMGEVSGIYCKDCAKKYKQDLGAQIIK